MTDAIKSLEQDRDDLKNLYDRAYYYKDKRSLNWINKKRRQIVAAIKALRQAQSKTNKTH